MKFFEENKVVGKFSELEQAILLFRFQQKYVSELNSNDCYIIAEFLEELKELREKSTNERGQQSRLIDADKLLESMNERYGEKKDIVPDNLAEGFMQIDKLIHEQGTFDLEAHDKRIRDSVIDECLDEILNLKVLIHNDFDYVSCALVINKLEQLKEKK